MPSIMSWILPKCQHLLLLAALTAWIAPANAQDLNSLASQISQLERAIARYEAAPKTAKPDPEKQMAYLLDMAKLATLYFQTERAAESWPLTEKILTKLEAIYGPNDPNIVPQMEAVATTYAAQGRFADAEKLRKRAIAINETAYGADSLKVAISQQGMAQLFRLQDRLDDALPFATRALETANRKLPAGDPQRAYFIAQIADIHMSAKRYDVAEPLLIQALAIVDGAKAADTPVIGMQTLQYLQSLGLSYQSRGLHAQGQPYMDRAIALSTKLFGDGHVMTGAMLTTLAVQLADQDQLEEAERLFKQALPISEKNGKFREATLQNYLGLGVIEYKRKNWAPARDLLLKAANIGVALEQTTGTSSGNRAAPHADLFLLEAVAAYRTAQAAPNEQAALRNEAFLMAQRAEHSQTAGALAQMSARVAAGSGAMGKLVRERQDLSQEWQSLDRRIEAALSAPQAQRKAVEEQQLRERMEQITLRLEVLDAQITKEFPGLAKISDPAPLSISEVQALLRPGEVQIFIASRLNQSLVWAISRESVQWELVPLGDEELAREVAALRCGLDETAWLGEGVKTCGGLPGQSWQPGSLLPFYLARAHGLYSSLLGPFSAMTQGAHLLVATSGPLSALPLHVLVTEPPAKTIPGTVAGYAAASWLANRNAISTLPSVSSLKALRVSAKASRAERPFFGIANPLLEGPGAPYTDLARTAKEYRTCAVVLNKSATANARAPRSLALQRPLAPLQSQGGLAPAALIRSQVPLPETAQEVCAVARDFGVGDADIRLAERATETEIKRLSANGELAKYKIVHIATHGALAGQVSATSEPGLLLTPPATATVLDDGYLTATEIAQLKLDADWVILSACNTAGAGKAGAETLSGLARAFFYAQARAVLASHWAVNSGATVTLITSAIQALKNDPAIGRAEALRRAMTGLINSNAAGHPQTWAPFVLVGEGGADR